MVGSPLPALGVTHRRVVPAPPQRALPLLPRSYGLMRPTTLLAQLSAPLYIPRVFAGCGEPLLEDGGSRRYLCVSVPRCLDLYPGGVVGACTHYFPTTIGLPPVPMRSAHRNNPLSDFGAGVISELQSFAHVQASRFAAPQVAPTAVFAHGAAVALTSEQNTGRYRPVHRIC